MKNRIVLTIFLLVACAWCLVSVSRADKMEPTRPPTPITPMPAGGGVG